MMSCNNNLNRINFLRIFKKAFSKKYDGIVGDVNFVNGEIYDGRPCLRKHKTNLPKRKYGDIRGVTSELSKEIRELKNPIYLTYNLSGRGASKKQDIVMEKR